MDRHAGIKVVAAEAPSGLAVGMSVNVGGTMGTGADGERYIGDAVVTYE